MTHAQDQRDWTDWGWPRPSSVDIQLIVVHRTANPRANALGNLHHSRSTKSWSIHHIVDSTAWMSVVPHELVAWHVKEPRIAASVGIPTTFPDGSHQPRGDVAAIGIEVCEDNIVSRPAGDVGQKTIVGRLGANGWPDLFPSPGGKQRFDDATYDNLLECLQSLTALYPNARIVGHGHLDPWTRNTDPFWMLPFEWGGLLSDVEGAGAPSGLNAEATPAAPEVGGLGSNPNPSDGYALLLGKRVKALEDWRERLDAALSS